MKDDEIDLQKAMTLWSGATWRFIRWVMECLKMVNYYILIKNGEPSEPLNATKGLIRQGDPMSPFLFALAMEYLSRRFNEVKEQKLFKFHPKWSKLGITHLSFADALLLFSRGDLESVKQLQRFQDFSETSRLQASSGKSVNYFGGVPQNIQALILQHLGYTKGDLSFKYLEKPLV